MLDKSKYKWIVNPETDVEKWINGFFDTFVHGEADVKSCNETAEKLRHLYRAGYCWQFAHTLQSTFGRGNVCWTAPFGHFCFVDDDGTAYDIEGKYEGEAFYMIPESYLGSLVDDYRHIEGIYGQATRNELISIVKKYCYDNNIEYDKSVERYYFS